MNNILNSIDDSVQAIEEVNDITFEELIQAKNNFINTLKTQKDFVSETIRKLSDEKLNELVEILIDSGYLIITNKPDKINNNYPYSFRFIKDYKDDKRVYSCCYLLTSPNGMQYIGQCHDYRRKESLGTQRPLNHRWKNGEGYKENEKFYHDINKYGFDSFDYEILIQGINFKASKIIERFMIAELNTFINGYNNNEGDVGVVKGYKQPWEVRMKRSLSSKGKKKIRSKYQAEKNGIIIQFNTQTEGTELTGVKQPNICTSIITGKRQDGYLFSRVKGDN